MKPVEISYQVNSASIEQIFLHLNECDNLFLPPLSETIDLAAYSQKIKNNAETFEAWSCNRLIGLFAVYCNDLITKKAFITNVSVVSDFSGKQVATTLMNSVLRRMYENNITAIELEVTEENTKAISLYVKHGFKIEQKKDAKIKMTKRINE